jgi:hypothetical protein
MRKRGLIEASDCGELPRGHDQRDGRLQFTYSVIVFSTSDDEGAYDDRYYRRLRCEGRYYASPLRVDIICVSAEGRYYMRLR